METDHWARQQTLLEKGHKRRFMRVLFLNVGSLANKKNSRK
jgi:hypothetical protein